MVFRQFMFATRRNTWSLLSGGADPLAIGTITMSSRPIAAKWFSSSL
jgi:hypothetical protein